MPLFGRSKEKKAAKKEQPKKVKPSKSKLKHTKPRRATEVIMPSKSSKKSKSGVVEKKSKKKNVKILAPEKDTGKRVYHVSKRPDGKWAVKFAGGEKAIKLFKTQAEAVEYTKKMSDNQDGVMLVHNSKGKNKGRIQ